MEAVIWWIPLPEADYTSERTEAVGAAPVLQSLGTAFQRIVAVEEEIAPVIATAVPGPRRHVAVLGAEPASQGLGLGGALIRAVAADAEAAGPPLCLWTATPANVPFYERAGLVIAASGVACDGTLPWWAFSTRTPGA